MSPKLRRVSLGVVIIVVILALPLSAASYILPRQSFPQTNGQIRLEGLNGPVDIYRDLYGIPQIYAQSSHDLFFAEGYVHAQDRFWQMDFWRHIGSGRLSEMFGGGQLEVDKTLRTMGWARVAQQELSGIDPESLAVLQAYADGVNAYLKDHKGLALSLEYGVLKLLTPGYTVEPWTPLNTLTWAKVMAYDLSGNMDDEINRSILRKTLSAQQVDDLYPPYPSDHPVIVPDQSSSQSVPEDNALLALTPQLEPLFTSLAHKTQALDALLGPSGSEIGSNNWVISGKLTTTGKPFLANDPHLAAQMPSIWYEIGLHCNTKTQDCPYEVVGFSFAGAPGVIIGHNDRIAWGVTNTGPDVQDLFIEKVNPANPNQYEVNGKWTDMQTINEVIKVAGGSPVNLTVRYTRHGPVVSDTFTNLKDFNKNAGIDIPAQYAIALRWTALEPNYLFRAILELDKAQNWTDFRQAASHFTVPAQNLVYADIDGNIGYQMPGNVPIRAHGDGRYPVPGWTDEYEWTGYIPFDKLPNTFNPAQGFVVTANNAVVGPGYPYLITKDFDYGFRAQRITDMIKQSTGLIDSVYIQKMQGDDMDLNAATLVPILMQIKISDPQLDNIRAILKDWDFQDNMNSAPAALFAAFWRHLLSDTFDNKLPSDDPANGDSQWFEVMRRLATQPNSPWWDNKSTPQVETRDDIFLQAFKEGSAELQKTLGSNPNDWKWGDLHTVTFRNQSLGESGIGLIDGMFNRGPFRTSGGSAIVNATGWSTASSYQVVSLPSMRMIVDLGNLQDSVSVITTGQSGHAYHPHYTDMSDLWRNIQYHAMMWDKVQIQNGGGGHLVLTP